MGGCKIILIVLIIWSAQSCNSTDPAVIFNKITGFVKNEAEVVHDKIKEAAHAVHDLFHPHRHDHPETENYPHHHLSGGASTFPIESGSSHYPSEHGSSYPHYPTGQGSSHGYYPTGQSSSGSYPLGQGNSQYNPSNHGSGSNQGNTQSNFPTGQGSYYPNHQTGSGLHSSDRPTEQESFYPSGSTWEEHSKNKNPTGQNSQYPNYVKGTENSNRVPDQGQSSSNTGYLDREGDSTIDNQKYDVDVRNGASGVSGSTSTSSQKADGRSLLAFKGCPEGERKDRGGKCRPVT